MAEENENNEAAREAGTSPQFNIQRTYLKDISFETPMGVKAFTIATFQPKIGLDVNTQAKVVGDNLHEVVLTITATARIDDEVVYLVELQQAGVFSISGFPEDRLRVVLGTVCPNFLFPYAREAIDSVIIKGSFPALNMAPIDFDNIFNQAQQQAGDAEGGGEPTLN